MPGWAAGCWRCPALGVLLATLHGPHTVDSAWPGRGLVSIPTQAPQPVAGAAGSFDPASCPYAAGGLVPWLHEDSRVMLPEPLPTYFGNKKSKRNLKIKNPNKGAKGGDD